MEKLIELIKRRQKKLDAMDAIISKCEEEKRELSADESNQIDTLQKEVEQLDNTITRQQKLDRAKQKQSQFDDYLKGSDDKSYRSETDDSLSKQEQRDLNKYSLRKALCSVVNNTPLDGLEAEMHQEAFNEARESGLGLTGRLAVPSLVLRKSGYQTRAATATGQTSNPGDQGGVTVDTMLMSMIDVLRVRLVLQQMGVTVLTGLSGNFELPRQISQMDAATEKQENEQSGEGDINFDSILMSPKRIPVTTKISKQLIMQSSEDIEALVRNDMLFNIARVLDLRGINGTGVGNQARGLLNTAGIGAVIGGTDGGVPNLANVVELETAVAAENADIGTLGYLTNTKYRGKAKTTFVNSGTGERLWDTRTPSAPLNGYRTEVSNQIPSNLTKGSGTNLSAIIFGNWSDLIMAQWGGFDITVDPYTSADQNLIKITTQTYYDIAVRHVESFSAMTDAITSA